MTVPLDLLRYVPKGWHVPKTPQTSEGGHLALIKAAASWYGKPTNWYAKQGELERMIHHINEGMENPRPSVEVPGDSHLDAPETNGQAGKG